MSMADTSTTIRSGMSVGSASMLISRVARSSTPPSLTPGASSMPSSSRATVAWIFSLRLTSRKSTCITSPRTGWSWRSLRMAGTDLSAPILMSNRAAPSLSRRRSSMAPTFSETGSGWLAPYRMPGTWPVRRRRRASRDPRSERSSTAREGRSSAIATGDGSAPAQNPAYGPGDDNVDNFSANARVRDAGLP